MLNNEDTNIICDTIDNLKFRDIAESIDFNKKFNKLNRRDKQYYIQFFEKAQAIFIKDSMRQLINPINIIKLGKFEYKKSRLRYYQLKEENPNLTIDEIKIILKKEFLENLKKK
jgi:hypothetical protein